jgi:nucleoside-diphosphate-sugar epimerase
VHISSTSALGDSPGNDPGFLINEETPRNPNRKHSGYSESKFQSEQLITQSHSLTVSQSHSLHSTVLNPGIILGPGQWDKGSSQLFIKAWEGMKFYTKGGTGYVDVRDVAEIITLVVEKWNSDNVEKNSTLSHFHSSTMINQRFCVVGTNLFYREFFNLASAAFNKPRPSIYAGKFLSGLAWRLDTLRARLTRTYPLITRETAESAQRISFYDAIRIKKALGFEFRSIEETVGWVCECFLKRL